MFTPSPTAAEVTGAIPSSVPSPTAISTSAMPMPVATGACPASRSSPDIGLPSEKLLSCEPM